MDEHVALGTSAPTDSKAVQYAKDWEAAESWLREVRAKSKNEGAAKNTVQTYRQHLTKVQWFVENVSQIALSHWTPGDVDIFLGFLQKLPEDAVMPVGVGVEASGKRPFRSQPSQAAQVEIARFTKSMLNAWYKSGYIQRSPMASHTLERRITQGQAVGATMDLSNLVMEEILAEPTATFMERRAAQRDHFVFCAIRGLGLGPSEFVQARMSAFFKMAVPNLGKTFWMFRVPSESAAAGKQRIVPVPAEVWQSFLRYRGAFGLDQSPTQHDTSRLLLSTRTHGVEIGNSLIKHTASRRYFGAWREVSTRQGLRKIVSERLERVANHLEATGRPDEAQKLRQSSGNWLRQIRSPDTQFGANGANHGSSSVVHTWWATIAAPDEESATELANLCELERPGRIAFEVLEK